MRKASFLVFSGPVAAAFLAATGCNAQVATVLASDDGGEAPTADAGAGASQAPEAAQGGTKSCAAAAGVCLPAGSAAPPNRRQAAPGEASCDDGYECWLEVRVTPDVACTVDAECNEDVSISALLGTCFHGVCICRAPNRVQPSGKCGQKPAPDCRVQGGACKQDPATCAAGELEGGYETNMTCGDFVPAVCCFDAAKCKAPIDLVCCGAAASYYEPDCVNGWKTCASGAPQPALRQNGCK